MEIKTIFVIGAGAMGSGIAQVAAQSGYKVYLRDLTEELVEKGLKNIENFLNKGIERGKVTEEQKQQVLSNITGTTSMDPAREADFVIEAVVENMEIKKNVFKELDELCPEHTILASNTSSLSITEMASVTKRPEKVVGMHFFNPAQLMKLVEVVRGTATSDETVEITSNLARKFGKEPITVVESPGFVVNRLMVPFLNEAFYLLYEGVASPEDIDKAVKLGLNHPMGPFELADFTGLDILHAVAEVFYEEFKDPKYRPCPLLKKYIRAGWLGRKTGRGIYDYRKS
jgi:3-hydroxybutyryl-CoA dehydrogenase